MTENGDLSPAREWMTAAAYVTTLMKKMAAGETVDPDEVHRWRVIEIAALSRYIAVTAVAAANGAGLPDDLYGTEALVSQAEEFPRIDDDEEGDESGDS
ncbi:MAG: hypothetical protein ACLQPH_18720 [Acidimicrobiales bacterium]